MYFEPDHLMNKPSILILSTHPHKVPRHGGQVRLANLVRAYEDAGWEVMSIAIYPAESYSAETAGAHDIPFPSDSGYRRYLGRNIPFVIDLNTGAFACAEDGAFPQVLARLPIHLDAIHVEQPWLWPLAKKLKEQRCAENALLINGTENIEAPLKQSIFDSCEVSGADDVICAILELEKSIAQEADINTAVTESDLATLVQWGARNPILSSNGINTWQASSKKLVQWKERLPKAPWILYVASAHPPNFTNFTECVGESLGCIPPDSRLVVAGGVSEYLYHHLVKTRWNTLNLSRLELLFVLDDEDLAAVKELAYAYLLPIPHGGGSNIKTAEAIFSGKHVIGSQAAYRGFDDYLELPQVRVAGSPQAFQQQIREVLSPPFGGTAEMGSGIRANLRWSHTLKDLPRMALELIKGKCNQ